MVSASAPGRLDVMGGIADYSGSLVLQMPIREEARCTVEVRDDERLVVKSASRTTPESILLDRLLPGGDLHELESAQRFFRQDPARHWASYVVGTLLVFVRELGRRSVDYRTALPSGLTVTIESDVPEGKGVSSSAALEVSTMRALVVLTSVELEDEHIARLCQLAENRVAGAPCGIMDQMTAACGRPGRLMKLLCQPAVLEGFIDLPDGISVWGIDSDVRHAVTGSDYTTVRAAAFMGLRIVEVLNPQKAAKAQGYLANLDPEWFKTKVVSTLPVEMAGSDFLRRFGGIADEVVSIEPEKTYPVRAATSHPVLENTRIRRFAGLLEGGPTVKDLAMAGEMMYLSHAGYSECGLGSDGTDRLVEMVRETGYKRGLFGARITGGGSGGTVAVLGKTNSRDSVEQIARSYERETGLHAQIF